MKAILFFALLAFAVANVDVQKTFTTFNQDLGLNTQSVQDGTTCLENGVMTLLNQVGQLYGVLLNQGLGQFLFQTSELYDQMVNNFENNCASYVNDVYTLYVSQSNGNTVQENFNQYGPEIIQQVAQLILAVQQVEAGQQVDVASQAAQIVKILIGTEEPVVPPMPQFNWTLVQENNATADQAMTQYLQSYFNTLGLGQEANVTAAVQCFDAINNFTISNQDLESQLSTASFNGALDLIQAYVDNLIGTVKSCQGGIQDYALILVPIYRAAQSNPAGFAINTLFNTALNLPQIVQLEQTVIIDQWEGQSVAAGVAAAQADLIIFNGVEFAN